MKKINALILTVAIIFNVSACSKEISDNSGLINDEISSTNGNEEPLSEAVSDGTIVYETSILLSNNEYNLILSVIGDKTKKDGSVLSGDFTFELHENEEVISYERLTTPAVSEMGLQIDIENTDNYFEIIYFGENQNDVLIIFIADYIYQNFGDFIYSFYYIQNGVIYPFFEENSSNYFFYQSQSKLSKNNDGNLCDDDTELIFNFQTGRLAQIPKT